MHPLSTFPFLLNFQLVAPLILRLAVGLFVLFSGWQRLKKNHKWLSVVYAISGILLLVGFYTQIASVIALLLNGFDFHIDQKEIPRTTEQKIIHALSSIILISLLLTGPGFWALDLPL